MFLLDLLDLGLDGRSLLNIEGRSQLMSAVILGPRLERLLLFKGLPLYSLRLKGLR